MKNLLVILVLAALAGCGGGKSVKPEEEPAPVPQTDTDKSVERLWGKNFGSRDEFVNLHTFISATRVFGAGSSGQVSALELATGKRLWERKLKQNLSAGVGYGEGLVLVATDNGDVVALDHGNGDMLWTANIGRAITTPPMVGRGTVVVRTQDGQVIGLSSTDGQRRWMFERSVPSLTLQGGSRPLLDGEAFVTGFASGRVVASEIETGKTIWEVPIGQSTGRNEIERMSDIDADPVLLGDTLYLASYQNRVTALDLTKRVSLWQRDLSIFRPLFVDLDHVYVTDEAGLIYALDRKSGETVWEQDTIRARRGTGPVAVGNHVLVGDMEGHVFLFDRTSGALSGKIRSGGSEVHKLSLVGEDKVLVESVDGGINLFSIAP